MRLLSSELVKLWTTRTPKVLFGGAVAISAVATAAIVGSGSAAAEETDRALGLGQGASFGTLFAVVIGILIVTNEYRHGTVMTTFLAEPRRVRVLLAKLGAAALTGAAIALAALAVTAAIAIPWLAARGEALELGGQALEAVGRVLLAFVLYAVIGAAVGAIVHSQVGALVGYFVWSFVVETVVSVLASLLLTEFGEPDPISKFLPGQALSGIVGGEGSEFALAGGWAALVALGYAVALSILGALSMTRRDP